jgi:hypothetical protein
MYGRRDLLGYNHVDTIIVTEKLADVYHDLKSFIESKDLYKIAYEGRLRISGPKSIDTLLTQQRLAHALHVLDENKESLSLYNLLISKRFQFFNDDHIPLQESLMEVGVINYKQGKIKDAQAHWIIRNNLLRKSTSDLNEGIYLSIYLFISVSHSKHYYLYQSIY